MWLDTYGNVASLESREHHGNHKSQGTKYQGANIMRNQVFVALNCRAENPENRKPHDRVTVVDANTSTIVIADKPENGACNG